MKHCNHSMCIMVIICISIHPLNVKMYDQNIYLLHAWYM